MAISFEDALTSTGVVAQKPQFQPAQNQVTQLPSVKAVPTPMQNFGSAIDKTPILGQIKRVATGGLGALGNILSIPQKALGGFSQGFVNENKKLVQQKIQNNPSMDRTQLLRDAGNVFNPDTWKSAYAGVKNIPQGIKQGITPGQVVADNIPVKNPIAKAGITLATDLVADPLNLVGAGLFEGLTKKLPGLATKIGTGMKALEDVPVAKYIPKVTNAAKDFVGEKLIYGYNTPKNFIRKLDAYRTGLSGAVERASNIAKPLQFDMTSGKELPVEVQRIIGDALGIAANGTGRALTTDEIATLKKYQPLVEKTLNEFKTLAEEQIKQGADPAIFENLLGKYYGKRSYTTKLAEAEQAGKSFAQAKTPRLDLSVYRKRADIPEAVRTAMGEVKTPAYGAATAAYAEAANIEKNKLFRWVAKNYVDKGENLVQLPKTEKLGVLSGRMVPKSMKPYLDQVVQSGDKSLTSDILKFFKKGKTIYSPSQLGRNVLTSQVQAFMNPSGRADSIRRIPEAIREIRNNGQFYKEAKQAGLVGHTFAAEELGKYIPEEISNLKKGGNGILSKIKGAYDKVGKVGSKIQNTNEEIAKMQVFINERKAGKTIAEAAKAAEETGFNYSKVTPFIQNLRSGKVRLGPLPFSVPFATYGVKSAELIGKTLLKQPQRIANIRKVEQAVQDISQNNAPNETNLPDYQKEAVRLPFKDKKGSNYYLNTKYLYPYGNMTDTAPIMGVDVPNFGVTPDPFFQEAAAQIYSKDAFTGKDIGNKPGLLGTADRVGHAATTFGPGYVRTAQKVIDAVSGKKKYATSPNLPESLIQSLGVPLFKYSPSEGAIFAAKDKQNAINDARAQLRKFIRDNADSDKNSFFYKKQLEMYRQQLRDAVSK